jgi:hypothetical protein
LFIKYFRNRGSRSNRRKIEWMTMEHERVYIGMTCMWGYEIIPIPVIDKS